MADDPNPALRAELTAALAVLAPQIRGLRDLSAVSISSDLVAEIIVQAGDRERRRDLIHAVISALDQVVATRVALEADGYPTLTTSPVVQSLFSELQEEAGDLQAAVAVFTTDQAATMAITLGAPVVKA
jgi:hypothetical protein